MKPGYNITYCAWPIIDPPNYIECANYKTINQVSFFSWHFLNHVTEHTVAIFKIKPKSK